MTDSEKCYDHGMVLAGNAAVTYLGFVKRLHSVVELQNIRSTSIRHLPPNWVDGRTWCTVIQYD